MYIIQSLAFTITPLCCHQRSHKPGLSKKYDPRPTALLVIRHGSHTSYMFFACVHTHRSVWHVISTVSCINKEKYISAKARAMLYTICKLSHNDATTSTCRHGLRHVLLRVVLHNLDMDFSRLLGMLMFILCVIGKEFTLGYDLWS